MFFSVRSLKLFTFVKSWINKLYMYISSQTPVMGSMGGFQDRD